jgi:hypothetical protein
MPKLLETNKSEGKQEKAPSYLARLQGRCSSPKKDKRFWFTIVAQMLPNSGLLPNNEATHPNVTY